MNFDIEKITNGYLTTLDGVKTFHDTPEAICGHMAEFILARCKQLDKPLELSIATAGQAMSKAQVAAQAGLEHARRGGSLADLVGWRPSKFPVD